uniref:glucuronosyltransferase n=1 Tax=Ditylenchus dipsaci TaxID=166011 RepID=A0A915D6X5_9BILA
MNYLAYVFAFFSFLIIDAKDIVLFASSGCYSHDIMMRQVGEQFDGFSNITWIQVFMYNFGFEQLKRPRHWSTVGFNRDSAKESRIIRDGGSLLWETTIPVDHNNPLDYRGAVLFFRILQQNQLNCQDFLYLPAFQHFLRFKRPSLVVVDHFLQECMTPPSAYPKTGTLFSSKRMDKFGTRLANSLFHAFIVLARWLQSLFINAFYAKAGYGYIDMTDVESKHLLYAGRSELLAESVRPISNRIKHFGCDYCNSPDEYLIKQPNSQFQVHTLVHQKLRDTTKSPHISTFSDANINQIKLLLPESPKFYFRRPDASLLCSNFCRKSASGITPSKSFATIKIHPIIASNTTILEQRYLATQQNFPDLDLDLLEHHKFILVSFGSVAKVEFMPEALLDIFLTTFGNSSFVVLWQTNSPAEVMRKCLKGRKVAKNVHLMRWAPIKVLLAHKNLHYSILHGGINTVNEVLMFGVPVLGIPLQGDQPSNLQRLVELGVGEVLDIRSIWRGELTLKMRNLEHKYKLFSKRAKKIASMVNMHRKELSTNQRQTTQKFWLHWAERHGRKLKYATFFHLRFRGMRFTMDVKH